jgi:hypothetical protein
MDVIIAERDRKITERDRLITNLTQEKLAYKQREATKDKIIADLQHRLALQGIHINLEDKNMN